MSKNMMYKEYAFIFDPADSFQYMYEFESKLDEFFSMTGYEVEKITNSDYGKCIVYIRKKDIMEEMSENDMEYNPGEQKVKIKVKIKIPK
jgi:hypothetical protein